MLQFKNVTIYRSGKALCRDLFLDIPKGTTLLFSGKNGSGKSTLISCLIGLLSPTSGQILLDQHDIHRLNRQEKKMFLDSSGIVLQHETLRPFDTIPSLISSLPNQKEAREQIHALGIPDEGLVHKLSYAQRRKLELLISLLKNSKLLIWDEPFMGLDSDSQQSLRSLLLKERNAGKTIIIASTNPSAFYFLNPEKELRL